MIANIPTPTASGNQPPSASLPRFAEKNEKSMTTSGRYSASAAPSDQPQLTRQIRENKNDVIDIVPVTAMPYAAASRVLDPNANTSARHAIIRIQLISGM